MSIFTIPIVDAATDGNFYFRVELDGEDFFLNFSFNQRDSHWYMDLSTIDGTPVRSGVKIVANWPLLSTLADRVRPKGEFVATDARRIPADPGLDDLGGNVVLSYVDQETLASLA
jgi:hypothetical protein